MMMEEKRQRTQSVEDLEVLVSQGHVKAKIELAKRLMEGEGVDKNEPRAVDLLEDCVAFGDAYSMLRLAKCCALGCGIAQNGVRAETLVTESAKKENKEAQTLMEIINDCKEKETISLFGL